MNRVSLLRVAVASFLSIAVTQVSHGQETNPQTGQDSRVSQQDIDNFRAWAGQKAFHAGMRANMRGLQIAVETYAMESMGVYPKSVTDVAPFLEGGSGKMNGKPGAFPTNPVSGVKNELPFDAEIKQPAQITKLTKIPPQYTNGKPGQIGYSMVSNGTSYAIIGTDKNGNAIPDENGMYLILSNQTIKK